MVANQYERDLYARLRSTDTAVGQLTLDNDNYHQYLLEFCEYLDQRIDDVIASITTIEFESEVCLAEYNYEIPNLTVQTYNGGFNRILTGVTVRTPTPSQALTKGTGKIYHNCTSLPSGPCQVFVIGTTVDRDTGATSPGNLETVTINQVTTNTSSADVFGNTVHRYEDLIMTSNWFVGSISIFGGTGAWTVGDWGHISFEQWNDAEQITIETLDVQLRTTANSADVAIYLYTLEKQLDGTFHLNNIASMVVNNSDGAGSGTRLHRKRRANLERVISGATDGHWVETFPNNVPSNYENFEIKVWGRLLGTAMIDPPPSRDKPAGPGGGTYIPGEML